MSKLQKELHDRASGAIVFPNRTNIALTNGSFSAGDIVTVAVNSAVGVYEFIPGGTVTTDTDAAFLVSTGILVRTDVDAPKYTSTEIAAFASGGAANGQVYYATDNDSLYYIGDNIAVKIGSGGGSSTLEGLDDVTVTALANDQIIKYDSTSKKWINANQTAVSGTIPDTKLANHDFDIKTSNSTPYLSLASAVGLQNIALTRDPSYTEHGISIDANTTSQFQFAAAGGDQVSGIDVVPAYSVPSGKVSTYFKIDDPTKCILTQNYPTSFIQTLGLNAQLLIKGTDQPANVPFSRLGVKANEGAIQVLFVLPEFPGTRLTNSFIIRDGSSDTSGSGVAVEFSTISSSGDGKASDQGRLRIRYKWGDLSAAYVGVELAALSAGRPYLITLVKSSTVLQFGSDLAGPYNASRNADGTVPANLKLLNEDNPDIAILINSQTVALFNNNRTLNTSGTYNVFMNSLAGPLIALLGTSSYGAWSFDLSKVMQSQAQYFNTPSIINAQITTSVVRKDT